MKLGKLTSLLVFAFKVTSLVIFFSFNSYCRVPEMDLLLVFSSSAETFSVAGSCSLPGKRSPGTSVTICGFFKLTTPVFSINTLSQIPVFLSRIG